MKRLIAVIAAAVITAVGAGTCSLAVGETMGDANEDGAITTEDAVLVLNVINGKETLSDNQRVLADVTYDGQVDIRDALRILLYTGGDVSDLGKLPGEEGDVVLN